MTDQAKTTTTAPRSKSPAIALSLLGGFVAGGVVTALMVVMLMPSMMIVTEKSPLGFDETIAKLEAAAQDVGWSLPGRMNMQQSLAKHGKDFDHRVEVIKLCHPDYAKDVLTTDRHLSSLMPCSISVWEGDDGAVYVSKMNTGLMGKLFGGNVARVMGEKVARDEKQILSVIH